MVLRNFLYMFCTRVSVEHNSCFDVIFCKCSVHECQLEHSSCLDVSFCTCSVRECQMQYVQRNACSVTALCLCSVLKCQLEYTVVYNETRVIVVSFCAPLCTRAWAQVRGGCTHSVTRVHCDCVPKTRRRRSVPDKADGAGPATGRWSGASRAGRRGPGRATPSSPGPRPEAGPRQKEAGGVARRRRPGWPQASGERSICRRTDGAWEDAGESDVRCGPPSD